MEPEKPVLPGWARVALITVADESLPVMERMIGPEFLLEPDGEVIDIRWPIRLRVLVKESQDEARTAKVGGAVLRALLEVACGGHLKSFRILEGAHLIDDPPSDPRAHQRRH